MTAHKTIRICITIILLQAIQLGATAQSVLKIKQTDGTDKEILMLPANYAADSLGIDKGDISTTKTRAPFTDQLTDAAQRTLATGGNIFCLTAINDSKQNNSYKLSGNAYYAPKYDQLRAKLLDDKNKRFEHNTCAYLTIYRPAYTRAYSDETEFEITVNDTLKLQMKAETKYVLKVQKAGKVKLTINHKGTVSNVDIDVVPGNNYYARAYANYPHSHKLVSIGTNTVKLGSYTPYIEIPGELEGELESSTVTLMTFRKKL